MKIIDRYIIRQFLGTLGFMLLLLSVIVIVIDVQSKTPRIESNGYKVSYFLIHFYPYWLVFLIITFMSILVFISIIFFTSRIANNTEIVAIISAGNSFHRFARPYFITAVFLMLLTFVTNHFLLPWANAKKNELIIYTFSSTYRSKFTESQPIATQYTPNEYIFIKSYNNQSQRGTGYLYQKFDKNRLLIQQISAGDINWNPERKCFMLGNFLERNLIHGKEIVSNGLQRDQKFGNLTPQEIFPNELVGENKNSFELYRFIQREEQKGNSNVNVYWNEFHQRSSMPISIFILSFLGLSLASQKKRGGLGVNIAIGIGLAFLFVFSFEALKVISQSQIINPLLAMWIPNLVFGPLTAFLYWKRAHQ